MASSSAGERAFQRVWQIALQAVERERDDELHAGGVDLLDAAAVDLVGAGQRGLFEQMGPQGPRFVDGAGGAEHDATAGAAPPAGAVALTESWNRRSPDAIASATCFRPAQAGVVEETCFTPHGL